MSPSSPSLIAPWPGSKKHRRYFRRFGPQWQSLICDRPGHYDIMVSPFCGGGGDIFGHHHGCKHVITADVDPGVEAVAKSWSNNVSRQRVLGLIAQWKQDVIENPDLAFATLKSVYENRSAWSRAAYAAAYLVVKRLLFGGVLRCNSEGGLNVALSQDKLASFVNAGKKQHERKLSKTCKKTAPLFALEEDSRPESFWGWQYQWPDNGIQQLTFNSSWEGAVQALADSDYERALVAIDAPYWTPNKKMTEAYAHHGDPKSETVMRLTTDCLDAVLATGKAARVVVFNYYSDALNEAIETIADKHVYGPGVEALDGYLLARSNLGSLSTMNNGQGTGYHEYYQEHVWEIGGRRMFRDHDAVQQLELVEA